MNVFTEVPKSKSGNRNKKWPAARSPRAAGHFLFPLPGFDFGTSLICSFIVLTYYHS